MFLWNLSIFFPDSPTCLYAIICSTLLKILKIMILSLIFSFGADLILAYHFLTLSLLLVCLAEWLGLTFHPLKKFKS